MTSQNSVLEKQRKEPTIHDFDPDSGSVLERVLFNHRFSVLWSCLLITLILGYQAASLETNANFERMIPTQHPFIQNYYEHSDELSASGNAIRVAVSTTEGTIFDSQYLSILQAINDELYLIQGIDRAYVKSLWMPSVRWTAITEYGYDGGAVIPSTYDGSEQSIDQVRNNVMRSGEVGRLVANDFSSSLIYLPLLEVNPDTGEPLDYKQLNTQLEEIRKRFEAQGVGVHIIGFAKVAGDLIEGLYDVMLFFAFSVMVAGLAVFFYSRCIRSTLLVVTCSLIAVIWQLGFVSLLGGELDPYSILVPFLVFAIGMSHGAQKMNGILINIGRGTDKLVAARLTFRRLFTPGVTAVVSDTFGFAVLLMVSIGVIQELAVSASIGVGVLIFTNLIALPVLLSFTGVSYSAAQKSAAWNNSDDESFQKHPLWAFLDLFTRPLWAKSAVISAVLLGGLGYYIGQDLKIGDLDQGAPELRADSRYNQDNLFITESYAVSSDIFISLVTTTDGECGRYENLKKLEELEWELNRLPGVESTSSLASEGKATLVGLNEGNMKWYELVPNQMALNSIISYAPRDLFNQGCNLTPVIAFLKDHRADTLKSVVDTVEKFADKNNNQNTRFLLAAGNAGIEAATNQVVGKASREILFWVYAVVAALCFITFRSWRAVLVAMLPLILTSILAEALMVALGIGIKVATLPVIALGVGIGVDYALYIIATLRAHLEIGRPLSIAYYKALMFTGRVVLLTGITLSVGVLTWVVSPIKFQADMGIMLAFMFLWNMLGALILVPALSCLLLKPKKIININKNI